MSDLSRASLASILREIHKQLPRTWRTRFAPAPTGYLHLGHAASALWVWGLARAYGGQVLLRLEDHDRIRSRPHYAEALIEDLQWLGLQPDLRVADQSQRAQRYEQMLVELKGRGLVYDCSCSRRQILQRAPVAAGEELRYPGTCRPSGASASNTAGASMGTVQRLRLAEKEQHFVDCLQGPQRQTPALQCGDLAVRDRDGNWTYQYAVTVDDLDQEIDLVIRGQDLLPSTGRQIQLAGLLGGRRKVTYLHHPLILAADGHKLSKSRRDTGLRELRQQGRTAAEVRGVAAHRTGLLSKPRPLELSELPSLFGHSSDQHS